MVSGVFRGMSDGTNAGIEADRPNGQQTEAFYTPDQGFTPKSRPSMLATIQLTRLADGSSSVYRQALPTIGV
jgi:hypothetical protein